MTVLLLGTDQELTLYRVQALEAAGIRVLHPRGKQEAIRLIDKADFDVAVLSYTLPNEAAVEFAELIRQQCAGCPLIAIAHSPWDDTKISPNEVVVGSEGPQALVEAIRRIGGQKLWRVK